MIGLTIASEQICGVQSAKVTTTRYARKDSSAACDVTYSITEYVAIGDTVQEGTDLVATPEHRARVFKAILSPKRSFRAGPRTVAQCVMGSMDVPSLICHSTLGKVKISQVGRVATVGWCGRTHLQLS